MVIKSNFNKKIEQKDMFKDVKTDELKNLIYGSDFKKVFNTSVVNDKLKYDIDIDMDKIYEYTTKIINGDLLIEDIQNNMDKLKKTNENLYNEVKNKIDSDIDLAMSNEVDDKEIAIYSSEEKINNKSYSNFLIKNNYNFTTNNNQNDSRNIYVTNDDYEEIMALEKKKNILNDYLNALNGLKVSSATLTGIAWGVAAFYWTAWWMWGANVAFAVAATTQAGIMTWFTNESWNTYKYYDKIKKQMETVLKSDEYKIWYDILKENINSFNKDELRKKGEISFSISIALLLLDVPGRTKEVLNILISKGLNSFAKTTLFKIVAKNLGKKAFAFANNAILKKVIVKATAWANPISVAISAVDTVLSITSSAIDIVFSTKL